MVTGTNAVTTIYVRAGSDVLAEYDNGAALTSPTREYVYSNNLLASITGSTGGSGGTITYQHHDHLSPRLFTDVNGNNVGEEGTYPFGEAWYNNSVVKNWVFTSYERDRESGNDYALARDYAATQGRFLSPDPLQGVVGDPQSWNRYAYVENDPINLSDPSGEGFWSNLLNFFVELFTLDAVNLNGGGWLGLTSGNSSNCTSGPYNCTVPVVTATVVLIPGPGGTGGTGGGSGGGVGGGVGNGTSTGSAGQSNSPNPSSQGPNPSSQGPTGGGASTTDPSPMPGGGGAGSGGEWSAGGSIWDECGNTCGATLAWAANFSAGAGDALTLGGTKVARKAVSWVMRLGYGDNVNYSGGAYWSGIATGTALSAVLGKAGPVFGLKGYIGAYRLTRWWPLRGGLYNANNFLRIGIGPVVEFSPVTGSSIYTEGRFLFRIAVGAKKFGWVRHLDLFTLPWW